MAIRARAAAFYRHLKIQHKILLAMYLVVFAAGLVSSFVIYYYSWRSAQEDNQAVYQKMAESISGEIERIQQDIWDISIYMGANQEIHRVLSENPSKEEQDSLFWFSEIPVSFISDVLSIKSQFRTLILYPENGMEPYYVSRDSSVLKRDLSEIAGTDFYQEAAAARGDLVWFRMDAGENGIYEKNTSDKIVGMKMIFNMSKRRKLGLLAMGLDVSRYEAVCENVRLSGKECIVITDQNNKELVKVGELSGEDFSRAMELFPAGEGFARSGNYHVFGAKSEEGGVRVYYFSPEAVWFQKALGMLYVPLFLLLSLLVCMWPLTRYLSGLLARPLNELRLSMDRFRDGDFMQRVGVKGEDEIGQLAVSFNKMAENMQLLIDQNYVLALKEKESELDILQAQINPHFLYNVLDSLYWQAVNMENDTMAEEILALSNLYRLVLNQGQDIIEVEKEFELIRSYLEVQKMRLNRRLNYEIKMDERILHCRISKLLVQPFVENAVVHGLESSKWGGLVKVCGCREGDNLVFTVEDNGIGMQQEEADRILEESVRPHSDARISHYAISNIQERLRLHYRDRYKLDIISGENKGTLVKLVIPIEREQGKDGKNV